MYCTRGPSQELHIKPAELDKYAQLLFVPKRVGEPAPPLPHDEAVVTPAALQRASTQCQLLIEIEGRSRVLYCGSTSCHDFEAYIAHVLGEMLGDEEACFEVPIIVSICLFGFHVNVE